MYRSLPGGYNLINQTVAAESGENFYVEYRYVQNNDYIRTTYLKASVLAQIALFGGFINFMRLVNNAFVRDFQDFAID